MDRINLQSSTHTKLHNSMMDRINLQSSTHTKFHNSIMDRINLQSSIANRNEWIPSNFHRILTLFPNITDVQEMEGMPCWLNIKVYWEVTFDFSTSLRCSSVRSFNSLSVFAYSSFVTQSLRLSLYTIPTRGSVPGSRVPGIPCHFDRYFYPRISFQSREIPGNNIPLFMHYI